MQELENQPAGPIDAGVILFNLGGPEALDEVGPFLYNLFSDPDIIRIKSDTFRRLLARFIAVARGWKSRSLYRQIGGGSPLRRITEDQASTLQEALLAKGIPTRVYVGMRCWRPTIDSAVGRIEQDGVRRLVALPLFPQYSLTTTGSCFNYFHKAVAGLGLDHPFEITCIDSWFEEPLYIESVADLITEARSRFRNPGKIHLLYSAHSIPARYIDEGDPYLEQTRRTVSLVNSRLGNKLPWTLAFQSRVGPVRWLGPSTTDVIRKLGKQGVEAVLTIPISFVSDHIETLQEIDIRYRDLARESGIAEFHRAASLNLHPRFIEALAELAARALSRPRRATEGAH